MSDYVITYIIIQPYLRHHTNKLKYATTAIITHPLLLWYDVVRRRCVDGTQLFIYRTIR